MIEIIQNGLFGWVFKAGLLLIFREAAMSRSNKVSGRDYSGQRGEEKSEHGNSADTEKKSHLLLQRTEFLSSKTS